MSQSTGSSSTSQSRPGGLFNQSRRGHTSHPVRASPSSKLMPSERKMASSKPAIIVISDDEDDKPNEPTNKKPISIHSDSDSDADRPAPLRDPTRPRRHVDPFARSPFDITRPKEPLLPLQETGATTQVGYPTGSFWETNTPAPPPLELGAPPDGLFGKTQPKAREGSQLHLARAFEPERRPMVAKPTPPDSRIAQPQTSHPEKAQSLPLNEPSATSASNTSISTFQTAFKPYAGPLDGNVPSPPSTWGTSTSKIPPEPASNPVCNSCAHGRLRCDGAMPACAMCRERGVACSYYAENAAAQKTKLILKPKISSPSQSPKTAKANNNSPKHPQSGLSVVSSSAPDRVPATKTKIVLSVPQPQVQPSEPEAVNNDNTARENDFEKDQMHDSEDTESSVAGNDQRLDQASVSSDIPVDHEGLLEVEPTMEAVTRLLDDVRKDLYDWQETSTQAELRQATIDARTRPQPKLDRARSDPFKSITEQRRSTVNNSGDLSQKKKVMVLRGPKTSFSTGAALLPKYKAIGRVSASMLAPNHKIAKYCHYSAEDENDPDGGRKYADWEEHYNTDVDRLKNQRRCQELVWLWQPWVEDLVGRLGLQTSDLLYYFALSRCEPGRRIEHDGEQWRSCEQCGLATWKSQRDYFSHEEVRLLPRPDDRTLTLASLLARAFHNMAGVSLWHIATGGLLQPRYKNQQESNAQQSNLCLICFRHCCPDHGSYEEPSEAVGESFINDSELSSNIRKFVALPDIKPRDNEKKHLCGVFCIQPAPNLRQLLGKQPDGSIRGDIRAPKEPIRSVLANDELCGVSCFWDINNRRDLNASEVKFQPFLSASQKVLVDRLIPFYLSNQRGPCLISRIIKDVDCLMVFSHMIFAMYDVPHPEEASGHLSDSSTARQGSNPAQKKKKAAVVIDFSKSADLGTRPPFMPCSHEGSCLNNPGCTCANSKVHCERFCGCDQSCKRRFRGCVCKTGGRKICFEDSRCECWVRSRECDPDLCGKCGVVDILESSNKYRDDIRNGRCRNNRIQLGLPAPTTKAPSQVQGYGLYSRAEIPMGDFIGEYTGEVIGRSEGNRRGTIYHLINQEYLFNLNLGQEIDASNNGNKMRFMNNSQKDENINVEAKSLLCSGVVRIGLFAKRDIRAGEELLWKYGYSAELVKYFWEPGEKPATDRALIPFSKQRLARNTGGNKLAGESSRDSPDDSSQSPEVRRRQKRKRPVVESPLQKDNGKPVDEMPRLAEVDNSDDSDYYETNGHVSEEPSEDAELDEEDLGAGSDFEPPMRMRGGASGSNNRTLGGTLSPSQPGRETGNAKQQKQDSEKASGRKRQLHANDRRVGGRAQQQGWQTRKRNMMRNRSLESSPK